MSTFNFKGKITGDRHQFGDNYYLNSESFIKNSEKIFSETEEELINLIFENFQSETEKKKLLNSLENLDHDPKENVKDKSIWKKFISQLTEQGLKEAASKIIAYISDKIENYNQLTSA